MPIEELDYESDRDVPIESEHDGEHESESGEGEQVNMEAAQIEEGEGGSGDVQMTAPPPTEGDVQAAFDSLFADMPQVDEGTDFNELLDALEEDIRSDGPDEREGGEEMRIPGAESVRVAANRPALQMVPLPASLHPRRGRAPEDDDEPHPDAASSGARGPDLIEEPGEEQPPGSGASGSAQPDYVVLDSFVDGGDTTQVIHGPVRFTAKTPQEGVDIMQDLIGKDSNGRAFWVIGCVTEGAVLDRLAGATDDTARVVLDWAARGG
jgi:hypothetical protein